MENKEAREIITRLHLSEFEEYLNMEDAIQKEWILDDFTFENFGVAICCTQLSNVLKEIGQLNNDLDRTILKDQELKDKLKTNLNNMFENVQEMLVIFENLDETKDE